MTDRTDYIEDTTGHAPHADAPVAVTVVDAVQVLDFPARSWTAVQQLVADVAVQVAGAHHARTRLHVTNAGPQTLWLSPTRESCTTTQGYPLAAGQTLPMDHRAAVWACAVTGQPSTLGILAEFSDGH